MRLISRMACALCVCFAVAAAADEHRGHVNHLNAPIGIMGDHIHPEGDVMLAYRYGEMSMSGLRDGTSEVTTASVLSRYMVSPLEMRMRMHMLMAMYGLSDRLTLGAMGSYQERAMDHVTRMGARFSTESRGFGDTQLGATYALLGTDPHAHHAAHRDAHRDAHGHGAAEAQHRLFLNAALSLPTGSIDERDDTPAMRGALLPYPMQLGSGTFDPVLGLTYTGAQDGFGWGAQAKGTFRLYDNAEDYRLGHRYEANLWGSTALSRSWQASLRLAGTMETDIDGADARLNPMMVPTADASLRGAVRVDALLGLAYAPKRLPGHRFAFEIGRPVYEDLDGPNLQRDVRFQLGWQGVF